MNFISVLLEGASQEDNKEEYRRQVLRIEKELEAVLKSTNETGESGSSPQEIPKN